MRQTMKPPFKYAWVAWCETCRSPGGVMLKVPDWDAFICWGCGEPKTHIKVIPAPKRKRGKKTP